MGAFAVPRTMKALWLSGGHLKLREDLTLPAASPGEVRVRVLSAGVCGTDLALVDALYPFHRPPGNRFFWHSKDDTRGFVLCNCQAPFLLHF